MAWSTEISRSEVFTRFVRHDRFFCRGSQDIFTYFFISVKNNGMEHWDSRSEVFTKFTLISWISIEAQLHRNFPIRKPLIWNWRGKWQRIMFFSKKATKHEIYVRFTRGEYASFFQSCKYIDKDAITNRSFICTFLCRKIKIKSFLPFITPNKKTLWSGNVILGART